MMPNLFTADRTRTSVTTDVQPPVDRTRTIDDLVEEAGYLRSVGRLLGDDIAATNKQIGEVHHQVFEAQLNATARDAAKRPATKMLETLARGGFAWRDIARMVGVSVPALRRWRHGEPPTGAHLFAIARLVSFAEILRTDHLIADVASWMEMPLVPEVPLSGIDLASEGRFVDLFDLAANHENAESILDRWRPGWRDAFRTRFEVFEASDGELGIRLGRDSD
jgi:hypothetical protein